MSTSQPERENKWVERRGDYALRFVPLGYRTWSWISLLGIMLGVSTTMFFLAWGGQLAQSYGTKNLLAGMIFGTPFIGGVGYFFTSVSSVTGLDSDLLTRGAGFGFMGSAVTSLIYSFNFLMFSAFEGSIMAKTVHARFEIIPLWVLYAVIGLMFIPLTWYGLTAMNWIMWVTIPVFFVFLAWRIISVAASGDAIDFWGYQPTNSVDPVAGPPLLQLGATVLALITNAAICADIGRFIPPGERRIGALALGFGFEAATFLGVTMLGAWFALKLGGQTDPGAYLTKGRCYVSPTAAENVDPDLPRFGAGAETEVITASSEAPTEPCVKCGKHFELAEFVRCPFHEGAICSVCCAAEPDCGELCKQQAPDEPTPVSIEDRRR